MSFLESVAPGWAAKRAKARLHLKQAEHAKDRFQEIVKRHEGASRGRRLSNWNPQPAEDAFELATLRKRSRDLRENNPFVARVVEGIAANVVGEGIVAKLSSESDAWQAWAETTDCDFYGCSNLYGLQSLVTQTLVEAGEVLIRRIRVSRRESGSGVPIKLQIISTDFLADDLQTFAGRNVKNGIEFDSAGRPVAYSLHKEEPNGALFQQETVRVPAADILHLFRCDRPGQTRGVPWAAPVMTRLRVLDDYEDAALERAKVSACFTAFVVESEFGASTPCDPDSEEDIYDRVEPGMVERLPPGRDVKFGTPPQDNTYESFVTKNLRAISAGFGVTYELMTGDLSGVNFSSGRMGWIEFNRNVAKWRWHTVIPGFCQPVFEWWLQASQLVRDTADVSVEWTAPRREMIDPVKETKARAEQVRNGFMSWPEALREDGYDPDKVRKEIAEHNIEIDRLGISLDSDPRAGKATNGPEAVEEAAE